MGQWSRLDARFREVSRGLEHEADKHPSGRNLLDTPCRVNSPVSYSKQRKATHITRHTIRGYRMPVFDRKLARNGALRGDFRELFVVAGAAGDFQHGEKSFLGNVHAANALHALLAFLLFFEKLALARDVSAVAFRAHVLANRADRFARDHAAADGGLDGHFEHLARNQFAEAADEIVAA